MTPRFPHRSSPFARRAAVCLAIGVLATSCSSDEDSTASSSEVTTSDTAEANVAATPTPEASMDSDASSNDDVCEDREALRSSVDALGDVDLTADGTDGLTAAIDDVQNDLDKLGDSASDELQPQVQAVEEGLDELDTAVGDLGSGGAAEAATALSTVTASLGTLLTSLDDGACG